MTYPHPIFQKELDAFDGNFMNNGINGVLQDEFQDPKMLIIRKHFLAALTRASMSVVEESVGESSNKYSVPFDENGYPIGDPTHNQAIDTVLDYTLATAKEIIGGK